MARFASIVGFVLIASILTAGCGTSPGKSDKPMPPPPEKIEPKTIQKKVPSSVEKPPE